MTRPPDMPDPRDPASPLRLSEPAEDHARSQVTVGELVAGQPPSRVGEHLPAEPLDLGDILARIPPERLAQLRDARDRILAELRSQRGYVFDSPEGGAGVKAGNSAAVAMMKEAWDRILAALRSIRGYVLDSLKGGAKAGNSAAGAMMKEAAALMRDAGLTVIASKGWESRGRSSDVSYWAVLAHHTGSTNDADSTLINGRSDLPGPLCNWALHENGDWVLIASGRANHAGEGTLSNSESQGIEATGPQGYPDTYGPAAFPGNYDSYEIGCACLLAAMGADVADLFGHKETARPLGRKIDPYFDMGPFRAGVESGEGDDDLTSDERKWLKAIYDAMVVPGSTEPSDPYEKNYNRVKELVAALNVQGTTTAEPAQEILFARVRNAEKYIGQLCEQAGIPFTPVDTSQY